MKWTDEQRNLIFEEFWHSGKPHCPKDHSEVTVDILFYPSGGYVFTGRCTGCGDIMVMRRRDDPRRPRFRLWTSKEQRQLLAQSTEVNPGICPVCDTKLERTVAVLDPSDFVEILCRRCGNRVWSATTARAVA